MKNKKYIPFGPSILLDILIFLIVSSLSITMIILKDIRTIAIIALILLIALTLYFCLNPIICYIIKFEDDTLSMKKDFELFKEDRIQKATKVNLKEIKSYRVILSDRNSDGEPYNKKVQKRKYIEFFMSGDTKKRLYVSNLSKKQLLNILDLIEQKTNITVTREWKNNKRCEVNSKSWTTS